MLYKLNNKRIKTLDAYPYFFTGIFEDENGNIFFRHNGQYHRTGGPAIEYYDGTKYWYVHDKRHRLDGPAIEWYDGTKQWYIGGEYIECNSNEQFLLLVDVMKLKGLL